MSDEVKDRSEGESRDSVQMLDERLLELTSLFEISRSLTSSLSIRSILENILRIPMGHMLISRGIVLLIQGEDDEFVVEELKGLPRHLMGKSLAISEPPERSILVSEITDGEKWIDFFKEFDIHLLLPLNSSQGTIGIVGFGPKIGSKPYKEREFEFLDSLSNIAATAVANGLNMEQIQRVNRDLDRKIQQLNTIFDISRELNIILDPYKIANVLSFAMMGELLVNKCLVIMNRSDSREPLLSKGIQVDETVVDMLSKVNEPLILDESDHYETLRDAGLAAVVPMRLQDEVRGILAIGPKISGADFDAGDLEFLKILGNQAAASFENARLFVETLEKQRMEEELNIARNMQQALLPSSLPEHPAYEFAAVNIPSRQVGGDYYDVIRIDDHRYGIAIADVSGKGAGAALLMANLQASLRALALTENDLGAMVSRINDLIYENTGMDKFITFFYGLLDTKNGTMSFCNAGHNPPYRVSASGDSEELMAGGMILGMMPDLTFQTATIDVHPGDRIVMFTDGITEAMDREEVEFGEERVLELIRTHASETAVFLLNTIVDAVQAYHGDGPQGDDITMVVVRALEAANS